VIEVTEHEVVSVLRDFGLTQKEAEVYVFLTKSGIQKAGEVAERLKMHKAQVYRILEALRTMGIVEATLDFPARFVPISFENFLIMAVKAKRDEALQLESRKIKLITTMQSAETEKPGPQQAKFAVVKGRTKVYSRILQLVEEAKSGVLAMTDNIGIIRSEQAGIFDLTKKREANFRILTNVSKDNYLFVKKALQKALPKRFQIETRHKDLGTKLYPRFVIKDDQEIIFFLAPTEENPESERSDTVLWTNNREIVSALKIFFEASWNEATDLGIRIRELETGAAVVETIIMRNAKTAHQKFCETVEQTKKEITAISPSKELTTYLMKCLVPLRSIRNIVTHIMVPLDIDNLETVEEMSKYLQVKYAGLFHMGIAVIDDRHLFMFKAPLPGKERTKSTKYFEQMLYTNDPDYVQNIKSMLEDLWYRAPDISDMEVGAAMRSPAVTVSTEDSTSDIVKIMHSKDIGSVVVIDCEKPIGIITEKDVLNRVVEKGLDPKQTCARKIMSSPLITISRQRTLVEALKIMKAHEIRRLVVVEENTLLGILSERRLLEKSEDKLLQGINDHKVPQKPTKHQVTRRN
jgi:sugar-specific transcriptional regulator TrmB/CBS domain-containing protein